MLKWPNDLILNDSKVGGILVEAQTLGETSTCLIGIGLNLSALSNGVYQGLEMKLEPRPLIEKLAAGLSEFERHGFERYKDESEAILWKRGERVTFETNEGRAEVCLRGLNAEGYLLTESQGTLRLEIDGEISIDRACLS